MKGTVATNRSRDRKKQAFFNSLLGAFARGEQMFRRRVTIKSPLTHTTIQGKSMTSDDPKKLAKDIADRASEASDKTTAAAKDTVSRAEENVRDFAARAGEAASDIYDRAQGRVRDAAERFPDHASDAVDAGRRAYDRGSETVGRQVAKQPIEALLLAAAIGYLVGWATNRS